MKKRFTGILICLVLSLTLLPAAVSAAGTEYNVWVNGEQFTSEKLTVDCGSGNATLDVTTTPYTLTLEDAAVSKTHNLPELDDIGAGIYAECALKVVLAEGTENTIAPSDNDQVLGIYSESGDITITGSGKLGITTNHYSIYAAGGDVALSCGGDVSISSEWACIGSSGSAAISCSGNVVLCSEEDGIYSEGGVLISCSGDVKIESEGFGICSGADVIFKDGGKISVTSNSSNAIYFYGSTADHLILNGSASPAILTAGTGNAAVLNISNTLTPNPVVFDSTVYEQTGAPGEATVTYTVPDHYKITLDLNGGTVDGSSEPVVLYTANGKLAFLPEPAAPAGKTFRMWLEYADSKLGDIKDINSEFTENTTLIAGYDVVFDEVNILIDEPLYTGMELDDKISVDGHPEYDFDVSDTITWLNGDAALTPATAQKGVKPTAVFRLVSSGTWTPDGDISTYHTYRFKEDTVVKVNGNQVDSGNLSYSAEDRSLSVKYTFDELVDPEYYDIKVNGIQISDANKADVLGGGSGVVYDPASNTLTLGSAVKSIESTITGKLNIKVAAMQNDDAGFTLTTAGDVEITGSLSSALVAGGTAQINAAGDVTLENKGGGNVSFAALNVTSGGDVTITANSTTPILTNGAVIAADGDVAIENPGTGSTYGVAGMLTVTKANDVSVKVNGTLQALGSGADITADGDVSISSAEGIAVTGNLTVNKAANVTVSAGNGYAITSNALFKDVSGNIKIESKAGMAPVIAGAFTVGDPDHRANNVTVTSAAGKIAVSGATIVYANGTVAFHANNDDAEGDVNMLRWDALIDTTGDILLESKGGYVWTYEDDYETEKLTLKGRNITFRGKTTGAAVIYGITDITATGDVLVENQGSGFAASGFGFTVHSANNVTVSATTGGAPALATDAEITADGDVTIKNLGKGYAIGGSLTVNSADNVTVTANGNSQAITGSAEITADGDVSISSANGIAVTGNVTVNSANYVEVTGNSAGPVITGFTQIHASNGFTIVNNGESYALGNKLTYDQINGANAQGFTAVDATAGGTEIPSETVVGTVSGYEGFKKIALVKAITIEADKTSMTGGGTVTLTTSLAADSVTCDDSSISVTGSGTAWTAKLPNTTKTYIFTAEAGGLTSECTVSVTSKSSGGSGDSSPASYTLTFNTNGGSAVSSVSGTYGKVIYLDKYVPTKSGFEFGGWFSDKELNKPVDEIKLTSNKTVYAKWNEKAAVLPFTDVSEEGWSYDDVCFTWENGLMEGTSETTFAPKVDTSRAMIVTILWRLEGEPVVNYAMSFKDVPADMWYTEAVRWAQSNGIVEGFSPEKFGPQVPVTREQLAAIFYRYAGFKGYDRSIDENTNFLSFNDFWDISEYAKTPMMWSLENGLIEGSGWDLLPQANATREQTAAILHRFFEKFVK